MNDPANPYAVSQPAEEEQEPICFSGTLTADDIRMSLRNSPPAKKLTLRGRVWRILTWGSLASLFLAEMYLGRPAFAVFFCAALLVGPWSRFLWSLWPSRREQVKRVRIMAKNQSPHYGWMDEDHLVNVGEKSVFKASWTTFSAIYVFPTHLMIPFATENHRRLVIPWQFFGSLGEVRRAYAFLKSKLGTLVDQFPDDETLEEIMEQKSGFIEPDFDSIRGLDAENWPFNQSDLAASNEGGEEQRRFELDLMRAMTRFKLAWATVLGLTVGVVGYLLPIWIGLAFWVYADSGSDRNIAVIISSCVIGVFACLVLFNMLRAITRARRVQKQSATFFFRKSGGHISHGSFQSWFRWNSIQSMILEEDAAGWIVEESEEEVRLPKACFASPEEFQEYKEALVWAFPDSSSGEPASSEAAEIMESGEPTP